MCVCVFVYNQFLSLTIFRCKFLLIINVEKGIVNSEIAKIEKADSRVYYLNDVLYLGLSLLIVSYLTGIKLMKVYSLSLNNSLLFVDKILFDNFLIASLISKS